MFDLFFKKKYPLVVLGCGGVGKTTFLQSLLTHDERRIAESQETVFTTRIEANVEHIGHTVLVDTPGQMHRTGQRLETLKHMMATHRSFGIINLVAYGYLEHRMPFEQTKYDRIEDALVSHRATEIEAMREWLDLVTPDLDTSRVWMLVVVTKADIWWDDHETVMSYYESGPFFKSLGVAGRTTSFLPYSSLTKRYLGVGKVAGTFDDFVRIKLHKNLVSGVAEAISAGKAA